MQLTKLLPKQSLNKAYLKEKLSRSAIDQFKQNFSVFLHHTNSNKNDEEHLKSQVAYFLRDTWYKDSHHINPIGKNDLVIHTGKTTADPVGVIIEVKSLTNKPEMIGLDKPNAKAFHELVLYYLRQRLDANNNEIKYLIATNIDEWFIFDANEFDKKIFRNTAIKRLFELKKADGKDNPWFYDELKKLLAQQDDLKLEVTHFNLRDFEQVILNADNKDDNKLIGIYKLLSPVHLLKLPFANDSNSLQPKFYAELLHLIGLTEVKEGSKKLIQRRKAGDRNSGSLLENAINTLDTHDKISRLTKPTQYGDTYDERLFNVALELVITWVNRILFLKLLEAQLASYHKGDKTYRFLNNERIKDFDDLDKLFFSVLAKKPEERRDEITKMFGQVPYLNSSLFEPTELEHQTLFIYGLEDRVALPVISSTVLKTHDGKPLKGSLHTIDYLFAFLDAYDFSSEGSEEIQEDNKTLINASVLGLIFEKINGYKDGSFFTPGFITMYMCRETIRRAVVQKFNDTKGWDCKEYAELYDKIEDSREANDIINSLKICDPAVGSGHFLVSALNEIIAIKSDLRILLDREGHRLKEYHLEVVNDELIITDEDGQLFDYNPKSRESQRVQEALFYEKQTIIENCLFGVDINPNSVKICRLRLWIELLKNAYYKPNGQLETLPNIDINIKTGNSLISRFALDADLKQALKKSKFGIEEYKIAVQTYRHAKDKEEKREMERLIKAIKSDFRSEISQNDPKVKKLDKLGAELYSKYETNKLFDEKLTAAQKKDRARLETDIMKLSAEIKEIKENRIYENAFEWRFEFPEVLNDEGDFVGFDVVIGNPPYLTGTGLGIQKKYFLENYKVAEYQLDLYILFIETSHKVLSKKGVIGLITPNSWLKNLMMKECRRYILDNFSVRILVPNLSDVFDEASVDTLILIASKPSNITYSNIIQISDIINSVSQIKLEIAQERFAANEGFIFDVEVDDKKYAIMEKVRRDSKKMIELFEITRGVNPYDSYTGQSQEIIKSRAYHSETKKDDSFRPELRGKHIFKYGYVWDKKHFISYGKWLAAPREEKFFQNERILFREILGKTNFICTYINEDYIIDRSIYIALPKGIFNIKYVLAVLGSKLLAWYFRHEKNEFDTLFPKIRVEEFKNLPIKIIDVKEQQRLEEIVDTILFKKKQEVQCDISRYEIQLERIIYRIYGLTEEEIKIVEGEAYTAPVLTVETEVGS